jgi:DOPA 4,5-dioxygenase
MSDSATITDFHAHVYYDEASFEQAKALCERARDSFPLEMGRLHQKPVGPHPMWSCQLAFKPEVFGELIPWLALNRDGLIVFVHPNTGNDYQDHSKHVMWLGDSQVLKLSIFEH